MAPFDIITSKSRGSRPWSYSITESPLGIRFVSSLQIFPAKVLDDVTSVAHAPGSPPSVPPSHRLSFPRQPRAAPHARPHPLLPFPAEFRAWLAKHHAVATELWVGFRKKHT